MSGRRKAQNEEFRLRIAKSRYRPSPITPVAEGTPFFTRNFFAIRDKTRAFAAAHDFLLQNFQLRNRVGHGVAQYIGLIFLAEASVAERVKIYFSESNWFTSLQVIKFSSIGV